MIGVSEGLLYYKKTKNNNNKQTIKQTTQSTCTMTQYLRKKEHLSITLTQTYVEFSLGLKKKKVKGTVYKVLRGMVCFKRIYIYTTKD